MKMLIKISRSLLLLLVMFLLKANGIAQCPPTYTLSSTSHSQNATTGTYTVPAGGPYRLKITAKDAMGGTGGDGIGGLGHIALKFLKHWGCEVIAFSSNPDKKEQILKMGASQVIDSTSPEELESIAGKLNFILNTTNVTLDWDSYLKTLAPKGKFHTVGAVLEPMAIPAFSLMMGEKSVGGSPLGSPALTKTMLEFCVRHEIYPTVEEFPFEKINEAIKHLKDGKARFRIVLKK